MAKRKPNSPIEKKDAELRKLLDKPDFRSFDKMMKKLVAIPKEEIAKLHPKRKTFNRLDSKFASC
jgi:hypothetical protein